MFRKECALEIGRSHLVFSGSELYEWFSKNDKEKNEEQVKELLKVGRDDE